MTISTRAWAPWLALASVVSCRGPCDDNDPPAFEGSVTIEETSTTATISWATDEPATTEVVWGTTSEYDREHVDPELTIDHVATLEDLVPETTYQFRARSVDGCGAEVLSGPNAFITLAPPPIDAPTPVEEPDALSEVAVDVALEWSAVTAPSGEPAEYEVQVDDDPAFGSVDHASDWIVTTTWTVTLEPGDEYHWRVRARDGGYPPNVSEWSSRDSLVVASSHPPSTPEIVPEPDFTSGGMSWPITYEWSAVEDPDGDPVEYLVQVNYFDEFTSPYFESGWIAETSWTQTMPPGGMWYWHVRARDADHPDAMSDWSGTDSFYDMTMPGSCPFLFVHDDEGWTYLTDIQGPAIGLPGNVLTTINMRHYAAEHVVLDGIVPDDDGLLRIEIRETQAEITYLDEATIIAVDHPRGTSIVSSTAESTYSYGYRDPFRVITIRDPRPPVSVLDDAGRDVTSVLAGKDHDALGREASSRWVIDFGPIAHPEHAKLVIDGWSIYGRDQYPSKKLVQPFVEVPDGNGGWVEARRFGNPAGDLKRMVVELGDAWPGDDHRIRLNTGRVHAIRWLIDRVALDDSPPAPVTTTEVAARSARLFAAGRVPYSRATLEYPNLATHGSLPLNPDALSWGAFTRYGDVLAITAAPDDTYAILRHGDGVEMAFPAPPPPPDPDTTRTYILRANLFYKHLTLDDHVEPLPHLGMTTYPYDPSVAGSPVPREFVEEYLTRTYAPPSSDSKSSDAELMQ